MNRLIFEYSDYKHYVSDWLEGKERGAKSKIAEAIHCHGAYLSQVLNGNAHLSLEQADLMNRYLGHNTEESDYLLLLVSYARAGTQSLRQYYKKKMDQVTDARTVLQNRLEFKKTLPLENQIIYYSSWHYAAVHLLLSIPKFQSKEKVASYLKLPIEKVAEIIEFLETAGLVSQTHGKYQSGEVSVHLGGSHLCFPDTIPTGG